MKYLPALATVCLLIVPSVVYGQQISPNPNQAGHTITVDKSGYYNWHKPFTNHGTIQIETSGGLDNKAVLTAHATLTNESGGTINNSGHFVNEDGGEWCVVENYDTFNDLPPGTSPCRL